MKTLSVMVGMVQGYIAAAFIIALYRFGFIKINELEDLIEWIDKFNSADDETKTNMVNELKANK